MTANGYRLSFPGDEHVRKLTVEVAAGVSETLTVELYTSNE